MERNQESKEGRLKTKIQFSDDLFLRTDLFGLFFQHGFNQFLRAIVR